MALCVHCASLSCPCRDAEHQRQRDAWAQERAGYEAQQACTEAEWQSRLQKAMTDLRHHREQHQAYVSHAGSAQQHAASLEASLRCNLSALFALSSFALLTT